MRHHYVARTVRGIEHVVAAEITDRNFGSVTAVRHREVWFSGYPDAVRLRTADDLIRVLAVVDDIDHTRAALTTLADAAASMVSLPDKEVDVTASFLGRRNYNRYDIEDAVGKALAARYHPRRNGQHRPRCGATVRVTIEGTRAMIGVRVTDRPLHQRDYRTVSRPGATHPPLAAAMCRLAGDVDSVLDPCCGVGTIPFEARALGVPLVIGSDLVAPGGHAVTNTDRLPLLDGFVVADAGRLPLRDGSVAAVVTNPPWGGQVPAAGLLDRFWAEVRRVLWPGGRIVVLAPDEFVARSGLRVVEVLPVRVHGAQPSIVVLSSGV